MQIIDATARFAFLRDHVLTGQKILIRVELSKKYLKKKNK